MKSIKQTNMVKNFCDRSSKRSDGTFQCSERNDTMKSKGDTLDSVIMLFHCGLDGVVS